MSWTKTVRVCLTDESYRLVSFDPSGQADISNSPSVYNLTHDYGTVPATQYKLGAYAASGPPGCTLTICGNDDACSTPFALTSSYAPFTYLFNPGWHGPGAGATFSIACAAAAYVAMDNLTIAAVGACPPSGVTTTITVTAAVSTAPISTSLATS